MSDVAELLQQLEEAEVAPPTTALETEIWHAIVERFEDRPWWHRFLPEPGFGRTLVTGLAIAGGVAAAIALVALGIGLVAEERPRPPVIGEQGDQSLRPLPEALRGGDLPAFRATVEVQPVLAEELTYVWEVSYDGEGRLRREFVEARGRAPVDLGGAYVVSDGRDVGTFQGANRTGDGNAAFVVERLRTSLIAPWSWTETWESSCEASAAGDELTCHDWRGLSYDVSHDADTGLVTLVRGPLTDLGYLGPTEGLIQVGAVQGEDGTFEPQIPPVGELRIVDVTWEPSFDQATFAVAGPEDAQVIRLDEDAFVADEALYQGPTRPLPSFSMTVSSYQLGDREAGVPASTTWRWETRDLSAWRVEAVANGDPDWDAWVGSYEVWDGHTHAVYDANSRQFHVSDLPWPGRHEVLLPVVSYLPDGVVPVHPQGFDEWLLEVCEGTNDELVAGRRATRYRCEDQAGARYELVLDLDTRFVLRRELHIDGAPPGFDGVEFEITELTTSPDLTGLDLSTSPPAGAFAPGNDSTVARGTTLVVGQQAPDLAGTTADGAPFSSAAVGRPMVVLFQSADCPALHPACRAAGTLRAIATDRPDVEAVWVSSPDARPTATRLGFAGTLVIDDGRETLAAWGVGGPTFDHRAPRPLWVVLSADGTVELATGSTPTRADLDAALARAAS